MIYFIRHHFNILTLKSGLLLVCSAYLFAGVSLADTIKVIPIISSKVVDNGVELLYRLPCGGRYFGLVAIQKEDILQLGIAYKISPYACTDVPEVSTKHFSWLDKKYKERITPLASSFVATKGIWGLAYANYIHRPQDPENAILDVSEGFRKTVGLRESLDIIYTSKCSSYSLPLFQESMDAGHAGQLNLDVLMLEFFPKRPNRNCIAIEKQVHFDHLVDEQQKVSVRVGKQATKDLRRVFRIKIAKTASDSIRQLDDGGLSLEYYRRCNDAPIGLVVTPIKGNRNGSEKQYAGLGVLLAEYYNLDCNISDTKKSFLSKFTISKLGIPKHLKLRRLRPVAPTSNLALRVPVISDINYSKTQAVGLRLDYVSDCSRVVGAVYHVDRDGNLSVGALEKASQSSCKHKLERVSVRQPPLLTDYKEKDGSSRVFPMMVRGISQI
ncbi:MAG: hypothetical protein R3B45_14460 [Bdellovibrionota bacterium]